jgi:TonB family protein
MALVLGLAFPAAALHASEPILTRADLPLYPPIARTARVQGVVEVEFNVLDGRVTSARIVRGASPILDRAALENVRTWQFIEGTSGIWKTIYTYKLEDDEVAEATNPRVEAHPPGHMTIIAKPTKPPCNDCGSDIEPRPTR